MNEIKAIRFIESEMGAVFPGAYKWDRALLKKLYIFVCTKGYTEEFSKKDAERIGLPI